MMDNYVNPSLLDRQLDEISQVVKRVSGINLTEDKRELIRSRLGTRLRALGFTTYGEYLEYLYQNDSGEFECLVDVLTTNVTSFFREARHFDFLAQHIMAPRAALPPSRRKLRIWSAGCSTGEEPYSIVFTYLQTVPSTTALDFKVLATDLSSRVLARAKQGSYSQAAIAPIPRHLQSKWLQVIAREPENVFQVKPEIKECIRFARLNLLAEWPMQEPLDVIFCRNVMIYFENDVREKIVKKMWDLLVPGGWLFVGQSENLMNLRDRFKFVEPAIYQKRLSSNVD